MDVVAINHAIGISSGINQMSFPIIAGVFSIYIYKNSSVVMSSNFLLIYLWVTKSVNH